MPRAKKTTGALSGVWYFNFKDFAESIRMMFNRREFLILTGTFVGGCAVGGDTNSFTNAGKTVNAGPVGDYAADGVYSKFRDRGFFIVRKGEKLLAFSATCTHQKCKLIAEPDC